MPGIVASVAGVGGVDVDLARGRRFVGPRMPVRPPPSRPVRSAAGAVAGRAARARGCGQRRAADGDDDLVAVAEVRGEVDRDEVGAGLRPAGERERVLRARVRANGVHAGPRDLACDVDHRLRRRRAAAATAFRRCGLGPAAGGDARRRDGAEQGGGADGRRDEDRDQTLHACPSRATVASPRPRAGGAVDSGFHARGENVRLPRRRAQPAGALGARRHLRRARRRPAAEVLRARDAAVPFGRSARGAREELHPRRRDRAHPPHARQERRAPDGLGRVRAAGGERGDPARDRSRDRGRARTSRTCAASCG